MNDLILKQKLNSIYGKCMAGEYPAHGLPTIAVRWPGFLCSAKEKPASGNIEDFGIPERKRSRRLWKHGMQNISIQIRLMIILI